MPSLIGETQITGNTQVTGSAQISSGAQITGDVTIQGTENVAQFDTTNKRLGVNNATPEETLDIVGNISIHTSEGAAVLRSSCVNVGVNTDTPAYNLDVSGDINFTGSLYYQGTTYPPVATVSTNFIDASSSQRINLSSGQTGSTFLIHLSPDASAIAFTGSNPSTTTYTYGTYILLPSIQEGGNGMTYRFIITDILATPGTLVFNTTDGSTDRFVSRLNKYGTVSNSATAYVDSTTNNTYSYSINISTLNALDYIELTSVVVNSSTLYWLLTGMIYIGGD